jgi:hypothetical protein
MITTSNVQVIIEEKKAEAKQQDFFQMSEGLAETTKITLNLNGKNISSVNKSSRPSKSVITDAIKAIGLDREFSLESTCSSASTGYYTTKKFLGDTALGLAGSIGREILISLMKNDCKEQMLDKFDEREDSSLFSMLYQLFLCRLNLASADEDPKLLVSVFINCIAPAPLSNGRIMRLETRKQQMRVLHAKEKLNKAKAQGIELTFEEALASARYRSTDDLTEVVSNELDIDVKLVESEDDADIYLSDIDDDLAKKVSRDTEEFVDDLDAGGLYGDVCHSRDDVDNFLY